jgi:Uncharacterized protein conserved in bacteria
MMNAEAKKWLDRIKENPYKFGHILGFEDLAPLHNEWVKSFLFEKQDMTLLAHRGSYKTTCLSLAIALMILTRPNKSIIFLRKTDTDVIEIVKQVAKILNSELFQAISLAIHNRPIEMLKETGSEINTNLRATAKGTSQLLGLGINTSITGKHADIVITDDIVNVKDRISRAERDRTKLAYMELQNIKNRGGRIINTGTPWHKEDAISTMPNVQTYDCYQTGLIDRATLEALRQSMSPSLFAANYELKHIADEDSMFDSPRFTGDIEQIYDGVCHIDASYGGADGTAFTIMKKTQDGYIVFGKRWEKHVDDCLTDILHYKEFFRAGKVHCETNADKGYLAKSLKSKGAIVSPYHESENKYIKISTHLRGAWKNILFLEDTDPDYINEILDYTENAEHDDSPDSLATIIKRCNQGKVLVKTFKGGI